MKLEVKKFPGEIPDVSEVTAIDAIRSHAIQSARSGKGTDMCGLYPGSRAYEIWMNAYMGAKTAKGGRNVDKA